MRQPIRFNSETDTRISHIAEARPDGTVHSNSPRPRMAVDTAVRRNNSSAVRAFLVILLVALLAMLAYLMSLSSRPSVTSLSPAPGSTSDPGVVTVEAHVGASKPIQQVTLMLDGVRRTPAVETLGDRSWVVRFQSVLPRGTHKAVVKVMDSKGNQQVQSWSFEAAGPRISPTITFTDPPSDATLPQGLLWIHADVQSDADISSASMTVNGLDMPVTLKPNQTAPSAASSDTVQQWSVSNQHAFSAGTYTVHLVAVDAQGDKSSSDYHFTVTSDPAKANARYFSSSQIYVTGEFLSFWESHDGSKLFGNPVSPRFTNQSGTVVQYFQNARFEVGKDGKVSLGLIGDEAIASTQKPVNKPDNFNGLYFQATGHTLAGKFEDFWKNNGGVAIFGYPISEVLDQNGTKVQYFERARFELSKDSLGNTVVKLTPLGSQLWEQLQVKTSP